MGLPASVSKRGEEACSSVSHVCVGKYSGHEAKVSETSANDPRWTSARLPTAVVSLLHHWTPIYVQVRCQDGDNTQKWMTANDSREPLTTKTSNFHQPFLHNHDPQRTLAEINRVAQNSGRCEAVMHI